MNKTVYKCNKQNIEVVENFDVSIAENNKSEVFVVNILTENKEEVFEDLKSLGISETICEKMKSPSDGIRFKHIEGVVYGEVAYFSSTDYTSDYGSVIIKDNLLIIIHKGEESIVLEFLETIPSLSEKIKEDLVPEYIIYWVILEFLSAYGRLIMKSREEIELIAFNLDNEIDKHSLGEISQSKLELASLEMVLDKLYFTLSFPPSKTILNAKSPYTDTFNYLLKNVGMLKSYVDQTQDRLDSLNDHYQLVMHDKGNKRLNFLTITQAIFVPLTLVVGIYGMNFSNMPELGYEYGYFITLGGMLLVAITFLIYFKKNGWFN
jgi:magnesium transporter